MFKKLMIILVCCLPLILNASSISAAEYQVPGDFPTIQAAIDSSSVVAGDKIIVAPGEHAGALVTKAVEIKGAGGAIISSGPAHSSGLIQGFRILAGGNGASINHLTFTVDFPVMNGAAQNDITISHCTLINPVQGISNWRGTRWEISHNEINDLRTRDGGGIAILIGDFNATSSGVTDNVVSHNKISGTLHVSSGDGGGYNGTGIVLYADFRWGSLGAVKITDNRVVKNNISLSSDNPEVVDVVAIELTDTRDDNTLLPVIYANAIGFNDLRGTTLQIALTPISLDNPTNKISRNLGENRGHGLHPKGFGPGGN